jgi:hypothetical protein
MSALYERGETFSHWVTIRDADGQRTTPDTITMSITCPNNNTILSSAAMNEETTGEYYYDFPLDSQATYGKYEIRVETTSTGTPPPVSVMKDSFYIMPWKLEKSVQKKMGITQTDITNEDLSDICWSSYREALRDVYIPHNREKPKPNPDTHRGFDGSNTSFQTRYNPIVDINGDGIIGDSTADYSDITCYWINSQGSRRTGHVRITQAENGEITITQENGSTAIPNNNKGVFLSYWSSYDTFDDFIFKEAVSYLASHYVSVRFTERGTVTIADLNVNKPIILQQPNRFLHEYKRKIKMLHKPRFIGV